MNLADVLAGRDPAADPFLEERRSLLSGAGLARDRTRLLFIGGLMLAPWLWRLAAPLPSMSVDVCLPTVLAAGLLVGVGVGVRMGNGCTSGHGVCGLSRCSLRSLVNAAAFMTAGFVAVFAMRHIFRGQHRWAA